MNEQEIKTKLTQLENFQAQRYVIALDKQGIIDTILTPEIKAKLADIDLEFTDKFEAVDANISRIESEVRQAVLQFGATVKSDHLQAVYQKGRISWDMKALDGYAVAHPEIQAFRKEGEPSVSLRNIINK